MPPSSKTKTLTFDSAVCFAFLNSLFSVTGLKGEVLYPNRIVL